MKWNTTKNWIILVLALTCLMLLLRPAPESPPAASQSTEVWTCSMHPQIRLPEAGACPICGMDLIRAGSDSDQLGPWELSLSDRARKLADIEVAEVIRENLAREISMVGKVTYDEKRLGVISAWVAGRIDRLFVDYTGIEVERGDHMVALYSPELVSAQGELMQALRTLETGPDALRAATKRRVRATREKLRLLGLSPEQIAAIETSGEPSERLTINAPQGGIVIEKHLEEGAYVQTGTPIYTIADLSRVWLQLEAYESDLAWLRYGQEVDFEVEAYPGETFTGRIVFIDPVMDPKTRTVRVRLDVPNPDGRLKPDMFVRAQARALLNTAGKVMDPGLAGKWICRMHPEVVSDDPGDCTVCEMPLVGAEEAGFATAEGGEAPLLVPTSAALVTGERAVVYVEKEKGVFEGRVVVLGPRSGDSYVVRAGLREGERVVVNGSFKIDSELQIRAKKSLMYVDMDKETPAVTEPDSVSGEQLDKLLGAYFSIQQALSKDDHAGAVTAAGKLAEVWKERKAAGLIESTDLAAAREAFLKITKSMIALMEATGSPEGMTVRRFHCPMAFDGEGGDWLQDHEGVENPYYGSMMYRCGSEVEVFTGKGDAHEH